MRFIGALLIMGHHLYLLFHYRLEGEYIFNNCWVWCDFFFILTGALTYKHFCNKNVLSNTDYGYEALHYTIKKYKKFFLLSSFSIVCLYFIYYWELLKIGNWRSFIVEFLDAPFEMFFLKAAGNWGGQISPIYLPMWFLSAMFIVLPIIIYLMQVCPGAWKVLSLLAPIIYFGYNGVNAHTTWPNELLRGFSCISLGTVSYLIASKISKWGKESAYRRSFLSIAELLFIIASIYISAYNTVCLHLMEPLFLLIISLMLSSITLSSSLKNKWILFLGKISMPIYIVHWLFGYIAFYSTNSSISRLIIYYFGTLLLSIFYLSSKSFLAKVVVLDKNYQKKNKK